MSNPPTTLGQYQIIREIARSNDIVYEAYDPLMNRRVAIKELAIPAGMTDSQREDRVNRFRREAQAAGTLNHPNIMTVYSFAEDGDRIFMALEYLDGRTLRKEIDTKGFLPVDRALEIAIDVLEGLGHAHSKGVIHRDIKPDNIQILSNEQVKITDFGIARLTFQPNLTMDGQVFGTPSYMSPEQVVGRDIDARSDVFSLAIVLYEMLSGQKPFPGDSVVTITYAIMNKEPQQPTQCNWALWQVLLRALDKSPQLRYANAGEMVEALREAVRQTKSGTMGATSQVSAPTTAYGAPMIMPVAPPVVNPYSQPPSPYPTAYNPYQPQPAQQPYGYQVHSSPVYVPGGMPPPGPIPVYYPPPPRAPLLKPEHIVFLKQVGVVVVILASILALFFAIVNAFANGFTGGRNAKVDSAVASQIAQLDPKIPLEERIQKAEELITKSQLPAQARIDSTHNLAVMYEQLGKQRYADKDFVNAEVYFKKGVELDPSSAALNSDLANLYGIQASKVDDSGSKIDLLRASGEAWHLASVSESDKSKRESYGFEAARMLFFAANLMQKEGSTRSKLIALLTEARDSAPSTSVDLITQIDSKIREVNAG